MFINRQTKISSIIKADPHSIDAIAALSKPLQKLKNPILRKLMAPRITLAEAAEMGGCTVEDFIRALLPLGFVPEGENGSQGYRDPAEQPHVADLPEKPQWLLDTPPSDVISFDVREMLAGGGDPLRDILQRVRQLQVGQVLCIINSFVPTPLVRLLEKEKMRHYIEKIGTVEYHTFFSRNAPLRAFSASATDWIIKDDTENFSRLCERFPGERLQEIDVRGLEMPRPMETILQALSALPDDGALYVLHKRIPVFLLDELAGKGFEIHICEVGEAPVLLLLFKSNT